MKGKDGKNSMSEYQFVEKPLLNQLAAMGWQVLERSASVILMLPLSVLDTL